MPDAIHIDGMAPLVEKVRTIQDLRRIQAPLKAGGAHIAGRLKTYPPQQRLTRKAVYGESFKSGRQRRYFFWALAHGKIEVPYVRGSSPGSKNLKQTWTVTMAGPLTVEVGTSTAYAPYVQGAGTQSLYHKQVGWETEEQALEAERETVIRYIDLYIQAEFGR